MPKYQFDEETMREYAQYDGGELDLSQYTREPNGELSRYVAANCAWNEARLSKLAQSALGELRRLEITEISVSYDGGGDEGFARLETVKTATTHFDLPALIAHLKSGPLGEKPAKTWIYRVGDTLPTRAQYAEDALDYLVNALASRLLGDGFGTGECSLEGRFVADLQQNTLTDLPPAAS